MSDRGSHFLEVIVSDRGSQKKVNLPSSVYYESFPVIGDFCPKPFGQFTHVE